MFFRKLETLQGWDIYRRDFRGRECWVARRHGVSMNTNTYNGIVKMIRERRPEK